MIMMEERNIDQMEEEQEEQKIERKRTKKIKRRSFFTGFVAALLLVTILGIVISQALHIRPNGFLGAGTQTKLNMLSSIIDDYYYKNVSDSTKATGLYKGLMESMDDPYTEYYTPKEYKDLMVSLSGDYAGIGAVLTQNKETRQVSIVQVYDDSPAKKAGLKTGDIIVSVDGKDADSESLDDFVQRVRGVKGSKLTMVYIRDQEEKTVEITREEVIVPSVSYQMLSDQIGYLRISQFSTGTQSEFEKALSDLKAQGMKGVIFDLRDNGGGMVDSVVAILDDILPKGTVVYTKDKNNKRTNYRSDDEKQLDLPMTVLVNENTASAAEIFTGAVMDFQKGTVIGTKTFGKGIVQTTLPLSDGSAVKLTTARYYTPKGVCIQGKGIEPDVKLELQYSGDSSKDYDWTKDNQVEKAVEILKENKSK